MDEASSNSAKMMESLPAFRKQFEDLETGMEATGDRIQALSEEVNRRSEETARIISALLKTILGVTAIFVLGLDILARKTVTKPIRF